MLRDRVSGHNGQFYVRLNLRMIPRLLPWTSGWLQITLTRIGKRGQHPISDLLLEGRRTSSLQEASMQSALPGYRGTLCLPREQYCTFCTDGTLNLDPQASFCPQVDARCRVPATRT